MELHEGAEQDTMHDDPNTSGSVPPSEVKCRKRAVCRVECYKHYEVHDVYNYKRKNTLHDI